MALGSFPGGMVVKLRGRGVICGIMRGEVTFSSPIGGVMAWTAVNRGEVTLNDLFGGGMTLVFLRTGREVLRRRGGEKNRISMGGGRMSGEITLRRVLWGRIGVYFGGRRIGIYFEGRRIGRGERLGFGRGRRQVIRFGRGGIVSQLAGRKGVMFR